MVVLDRMLEWQPGEARCELTLNNASTFVRDGAVDALVSIEYLAQSVAACLGYEAYQAGDGVRVGMVIASRSLELNTQQFHTGETLRTHVERIRGNQQLSHFGGILTRDEQIVATANLTIYHAEKPPES